MSSCEAFRGEIVALERDELPAPAADAVRAHLVSCAACAAVQRKLRRAAQLFARVTDVEPRPHASARLRRAVDAALAESHVRPAGDAEPARASRPRGMLRDAWEHARWRYERSSTVRRFALASIGVHAAAAAVLIVLLAGRPGAPDRHATITIEPGEPVSLAEDPASPGERSLPAFDPMSPDGVETAALPGRRFPNHTTASRWSVAMTADGRRATFRAALGDDGAAVVLDRGLDWLRTMRGADGAMPGSDAVETTSAAVLAFASSGRSSADDPGLGLSVDWLERRAGSGADGAGDVADRALATRALAAQFVTDFGRLPREARTARAQGVATAAAAVASSRNADGGWGARPGAASDAASTVAAVAALADARACGVADTTEALGAASAWLERRRSPDGLVSAAVARDPVGVTAMLAAASPDAGVRPLSPHAVSTLSMRVAQGAGSARHAAAGAEALVVLGRPVRDVLSPVLASQRADGSYGGSGRAASKDPVSETAWASVALTRALRR